MRISDVFSGITGSPPPTDAECDSIARGDYARDACRRLQDPDVWRSGPTEPDDYPPVPR
jgi:hypothetical protein